MPIYKKKNDDFFKKWTLEMTYILGFFCADGAMTVNPRGAHYIEFQNTESGLLEKFATALGSNHKISRRVSSNKNWKDRYRLQIGSKKIFSDLITLGLRPRKADRLMLPAIPKKYFADFVRGYFDGDGNVWRGYTHRNDRKNPVRMLLVRFNSVSKKFLFSLANRLKAEAGLKSKISLLFYSGAWRLSYSTNDCRKLYYFMYNSGCDLFFERKRRIFEAFILGPVV